MGRSYKELAYPPLATHPGPALHTCRSGALSLRQPRLYCCKQLTFTSCFKQAVYSLPLSAAKIICQLINCLSLATWSKPTSNPFSFVQQEMRNSFQRQHKNPPQTKGALQSPPLRALGVSLASGAAPGPLWLRDLAWLLSHMLCVRSHPTGTCGVKPAGCPTSSTCPPQGQAGTHDFRNEEHIWESCQNIQAAGQRGGGSCRGHCERLSR